jgi:bifunctional ADP-heptose synthase (sugar kinase/adenylyltransferase)
VTTISSSRLEAILGTFGNLTIGLVGDLFLDRYLELAPDVHERSIETGLEAYQVARVRNSPGALGTVMINLAALGVGRLRPVTVIGDDGHGYDLRKEIGRLPVDSTYVLTDPERLTPTYTKPLRQVDADQWEELNRLDVRTRAPLTQQTCHRLRDALRDVMAASDGLMVLDQVHEENWGVVNHQIRDFLGDLAEENPRKLVFIDSRAHLGRFSFGVLKGNQAELLAAASLRREGEDAVRGSMETLSQRTGRPVFCTLGERGILVAQPADRAELVAGCPVTGPVDIVGAGDAASSGIVASLLGGADELEAAAVGNLVASITVQQLGTTGTASPRQIRARWREVHDSGRQRDGGKEG